MVEYKEYGNDTCKEYLFVNFDYYDGSNYIAELFCKLYGAKVIEMKNYIWHSIILMLCGDDYYELRWHEDTGNSICVINGDEDSNKRLEERLHRIVEELNR